MYNSRIDHTVLDRLTDDILRVLFRVEVELEADVAQGDARVGKGELSDARFDHVLSEARNQRQSSVRGELRGAQGERRLELVEGACAHGWMVMVAMDPVNTDEADTRELKIKALPWTISE